GDLLVVGLSIFASSGSGSLRSGWSRLLSVATGGGPIVALYERVADDEPASYPFSVGSTSRTTMMAFRRASAVGSFLVGERVGGDTTVSPSIVAQSGSLLCGFFTKG